MHPEFPQQGLCMHSTHPNLSMAGLRELRALVDDVVGHSHVVVAASDQDLTKIYRDLAFVGDFFEKFRLQFRFARSDVEQLRSVVYQTTCRFKNMEVSMLADLAEMENYWLRQTGICTEMQ
jgi:hypothetical protein